MNHFNSESESIISQQTRDIETMLVQCLAGVVDGGNIEPTLIRCLVLAGIQNYWLDQNINTLPAGHDDVIMSHLYRGGDILLHLPPLVCSSNTLFCVCAFSPSILQAVKQETVFVSVRSLSLSCRLSNTRRWPNAGLRSANISPVLGHQVMFDATLNVGQRHRRGSTLTQLWFKASRPYREHAGTFCMYVAYDRPCRQGAFARCWYSVDPKSAALDRRCTGVGWTYILFCCDDVGGCCSVDSTHWPSVDLVPGCRWTGIESALGLFLLFAGWSDDEKI